MADLVLSLIVGLVVCIIIPCLVYFLYLSLCRMNEIGSGSGNRQDNVITIYNETIYERRYDERMRAQLEKDKKDLPSYEEVMGMSNLSSPTAAPASQGFETTTTVTPIDGSGAVSVGASSSSVNTTDTVLSEASSSGSIAPPPYSPATSSDAVVVLPLATSSPQTQ